MVESAGEKLNPLSPKRGDLDLIFHPFNQQVYYI